MKETILKYEFRLKIYQNNTWFLCSLINNTKLMSTEIYSHKIFLLIL